MTFPRELNMDAPVGRRGELALIHAFLFRASTHGGALLVLGEAGVGKTQLLDVAEQAAAAAGTRVLRAGGVEFEAEMSFSGLNQAVDPDRHRGTAVARCWSPVPRPVSDSVAELPGGRVDVLANVAGIMDYLLPFDELDDATWDRVIGVNR